MDVPKIVVIVIVVSVVQLAKSSVAAVDYLVGDEKGWTPNIDYRAWTKDKFFRVGDKLVFRYPSGASNVLQVKRYAFKNCMADSTSEALTSGNDVIELTRPGRKWYISSVGDHCNVGKQKLGITVFPASFNLRNLHLDPKSLRPLLPLAPWLALLPFFQLPLSPAPAPSSSNAPSLPPAPTPAPTFDFPSLAPISPLIPFMPWIFPFLPLLPGIQLPSVPAPAPSLAPSFDIRKLFFPPAAAPAPSI